MATNNDSKKSVGQARLDLGIDLAKIAVAGTAAVFVAKAVEDNWGEGSVSSSSLPLETPALPIAADGDTASIHSLSQAEFNALYGG